MNLNANYTKIKNRKKQNKEDPCTVIYKLIKSLGNNRRKSEN